MLYTYLRPTSAVKSYRNILMYITESVSPNRPRDADMSLYFCPSRLKNRSMSHVRQYSRLPPEEICYVNENGTEAVAK